MEPQALSIKSKPKLEPTALSIKAKPKIEDQPKALNIKSSRTIMPIVQDKFDFSFEYLKSKIPEITTFMFSEINKTLSNVEQQNPLDNDILLLGKKLQERIAEKSVQASSIQGGALIERVSNSHKIIAMNIETADKGFSGFFKKLLGTEKNKEEIIQAIKHELNVNKTFKNDISQFTENYPRLLNQFESLRTELHVNIEVLKLMLEEFSIKDQTNNIDLVNRRISSLNQSRIIIETASNMIKAQESKMALLQDTIDNVVNILVPILLNKMTFEDMRDSSFHDLSQDIIKKLQTM
jgi:hypothetical protein